MASISRLVRIAFVLALMVARLLPAISGAPEIAHRLRCVRFCASLNPGRPAMSMSGSLEWPGLCALGCWAASKLASTRAIDGDSPKKMMSPLVRHRLEMGGGQSHRLWMAH